MSYSHKDKAFVDRLAADLESSGASVWIDRREIKPGDSIIDIVHDQIRRSGFLLAILSPAFVASRFARQELSEARMAQLSRRRIKVIPVLADRCTIPALLSSIQYADFTKSYAFGLQAIRHSLGLPAQPSAMLIRNETATLTLRQRGKVACFLFERAVECEVPKTSRFVDLNVYCDITPANVRVSPGSTEIEALPGLYKLHTTLAAPLPLYKPVRRRIYYELRGPYDDPEGYWFYRMPSRFDWALARVVFPRNRLPRKITAVFERDGIDHPAPHPVRRKVATGFAYSVRLDPDMGRFRTVRFDWLW